MTVKITLGLHLDGEHGWHAANRLGEPILGPMGLLTLLETQLGLLRAECAHAERVLQYRDCLGRCDGPTRFFHDSFSVDPLGTASMLLAWRDRWWLHGWNGEATSSAGVRLKDMAAIEGAARSTLAPCVGERLARVSEALADRRLPFERILLIDPLESFPKRWRDVLTRLPQRSFRAFAPAADPSVVLGELQVALASAHAGRKPEKKIRWRDDGSLRIVRAETKITAARWVAQFLQTVPGDTALVAEQERALLDMSLDAADAPRQGFQEPSPFTPALQVLPLALAIVWEPLDVYALLQFLSHPIGPVPGYARSQLAELVAECPGIGGERWEAAMRKIGEDVPERAADVRDAVAFWIHQPRYRREHGAPIPALVERSRRLRDYFAALLAGDDPVRAVSSATAFAQTSAVTDSLEALLTQGETTISPGALQSLVSQCTGRGASTLAMPAEVGWVPSAADPAALIEPFDRVIWWQMAAPVLPRRYPWTRSELAALAEAGADIPSLSAVLAQQSMQWLRPVLNARQQLVLVLPPVEDEVHPLWQEIEWFVEGIRIEALEDLMTSATAADLSHVAHAPLPRARRFWRLPPEIELTRRACESFSSLSAFLNCPHQWVLRYAARLSPSNLLDVADGNRLYGNLAHRLIDRFFRSDDTHKLEGKALERWVVRELERVVADEGAVLVMPGRRSDHERLRSSIIRALDELQRQFVRAGAVRVESERRLKGTFVGGDLDGLADLVVRNQKERQAIVDMKWSGSGYYRQRFAENRHLQLAVYAEMLRQETGLWPDVSYFILSTCDLFARDAGFFPNARSVQRDAEISAPVLWQQFIAAWKWRRAQLDQGRIEIVIERIPPTEGSTAPEGALQPEAIPEAFNDYRWLAGWEA